MSQRLGEYYNRYNKNQQYDTYNKYDMEVNKYNTNINTNDIPLSIKNEPEIDYIKQIEYVTISSRDRDMSVYPSPNHYCIKLPHDLKNIYSVEIINGVIPDQNNVKQEPYLLLKIDELMYENMISVDKNMSDAFAILHMSPPISSGYFINVDKKTFEHTVLRFETPKASLSKLTVTLTDCDGVPFDFGAEPDPNVPAKSLQNTFIFRIVTYKKNHNILKQRNVY